MRRSSIATPAMGSPAQGGPAPHRAGADWGHTTDEHGPGAEPREQRTPGCTTEGARNLGTEFSRSHDTRQPASYSNSGAGDAHQSEASLSLHRGEVGTPASADSHATLHELGLGGAGQGLSTAHSNSHHSVTWGDVAQLEDSHSAHHLDSEAAYQQQQPFRDLSRPHASSGIHSRPSAQQTEIQAARPTREAGLGCGVGASERCDCLSAVSAVPRPVPRMSLALWHPRLKVHAACCWMLLRVVILMRCCFRLRLADFSAVGGQGAASRAASAQRSLPLGWCSTEERPNCEEGSGTWGRAQRQQDENQVPQASFLA